MSRFDNFGLFWNDVVKDGMGRTKHVRPMPPIPDTGWRAPQEFPNLASATTISYDVETYDPGLRRGKETTGPGWARGEGHIVGVAIGAVSADGQRGRWYLPIRHEVEPQDNLDPETVLNWVNYVLKDNRPKVGANLLYDYGWLKQEGVRVGGKQYDVQFAEALIESETPSVSLEALSQKYLGQGKITNILYEWCANFYGGKANEKQRANIYRAPPRLVGPYAEGDADLPLSVLERQWPVMDADRLLDLFHTECGLIPLLVEMRMRGVPVDLPYAERLHDQFGKDIIELDEQISYAVGFDVNVNASESLARAFDELGLDYPRTAPTEKKPEGSPSFVADWLEAHEHPVAQLINSRRQKQRLRGTFIESYLLKNSVNGRVHCQFHPLKGDDNGARSGRFASSDPNLQNIPVRTVEGKLIRKCFVATGVRWRKYDHSQIEYRMLANHAVGGGAENIRQRYINNPATDYHVETQDMILNLAGLDLERRNVKTINFGLIYGMSQPELARRLHLDSAGGRNLFAAYHLAVPFAKATMEAAAEEAALTGYVTTVLGRKSRFNLWEVQSRGGDRTIALPLERALEAYPGKRLQRAYLHKALNRKLQGGAADVMKKGMLDCYEQGVFDYTGFPNLTVHDELDFDDMGGNDEAFDYMQRTLENCMPQLRIPLLVDLKTGPNWGDAD